MKKTHFERWVLDNQEKILYHYLGEEAEKIAIFSENYSGMPLAMHLAMIPSSTVEYLPFPMEEL